MSDRPAHFGNWIALIGLVLAAFAIGLTIFTLFGGKEWMEARGWGLNPQTQQQVETTADTTGNLPEVEPSDQPVAKPSTEPSDEAESAEPGANVQEAFDRTNQVIRDGFWGQSSDFGDLPSWIWGVATVSLLMSLAFGWSIASLGLIDDELWQFWGTLLGSGAMSIGGTLVLDAAGFPYAWLFFLCIVVGILPAARALARWEQSS